MKTQIILSEDDIKTALIEYVEGFRSVSSLPNKEEIEFEFIEKECSMLFESKE